VYNDFPMKSTLYLIRHGQTDWNLNRRLQGHQDIPLNETGLQQARLLSEELKGMQFDVVYASDLQRACQTAQHLSTDIKIDPRLREMSFGIYEGVTWPDFQVQFDEQFRLRESLSFDEKHRLKFHDTVESYFEVYTRAKECLDEIMQANPGKHIAVATHGGLIKSILSMLQKTNPFQIQVDNIGYVVLRVEGTKYTPIRYCRIEGV
jgi:probable phosphoglycerate mutase